MNEVQYESAFCNTGIIGRGGFFGWIYFHRELHHELSKKNIKWMEINITSYYTNVHILVRLLFARFTHIRGAPAER